MPTNNKLRVKGVGQVVSQPTLYLTNTADVYNDVYGYIGTTTGYIKVTFWDGSEEIFGNGDVWTPETGYTIYFSKYVTESNNIPNKTVQIISCDVNGNPSGDIKVVEASGSYYSSINVSNLPNLVVLNCGGNSQITTLNLNGLNNLQALYIDSTGISSLEFLNGLTSLKELFYNNTGIQSPDLSSLTGLEFLGCENNNLTSLDFALTIPNLKTIFCGNNPDLTEIDLLDFPNLERLYAGYNSGLESINLVSNNLKVLALEVTSFTSLDLSDLPNLERAFLGEMTGLTSVNITGLSNLIDLRLYNTQVSSIDLSQVPNLEILNIGQTQITSLDLSYVPNLIALNVDNLDIPSIDFSYTPNLEELVAHYSSTEFLNLDSTVITGLLADYYENTSIDLSGVTTLVNVYLNFSQITSIDVSGFQNLQNLYLYETLQLVSVDVSNCSNLTQLSIGNSSVVTVDASNTLLSDVNFNGCTQLTTLNLSGCTGLTYVNLNNVISLTSLNIEGCTSLPQLHTNYCYAFTPEIHDDLLIMLDNNGVENGNFSSVLVGRTSASDVAYNNLINKGWYIDVTVKHLYLTAGQLPGETVDGQIRTNTGYIKISFWDGTEQVFGNGAPWPPTYFSKVIDENDTYENRVLDIIACNSSGVAEGQIWFVDIGNKNYTNIDVSQATNISQLFLYNTPLTSVDTSNLSLFQLNIQNTQISSIDLSNSPNIYALWIGGTPISSIDISGSTNLQYFGMSNTNITSIDLSGCVNLTEFQCQNTQITSLDLNGLTNLQTVYLDGSPLTSLGQDLVLNSLALSTTKNNGSLTGDFTNRTSNSDSAVDVLVNTKGWNIPSLTTTTTTTEEPTTTTTTTEEPTTTTTTTEPVFYTYDFSSLTSVNGEFPSQFNKYGVTNWDGTYRIVATNLNIGTLVYYIGTDGNKHLFTFDIPVIQDGSNYININQTGIYDKTGTVTFDSVTPFVVSTTTTTTAAPFTVYNFSSFLNEDKQQFAEILMQYIQANSLMPWDGTFRIVASDISLGNIVYYIGTDGNKYPFTGYLEDVNGNIDFNVTQGLFDVTGTMSWTSTAPF